MPDPRHPGGADGYADIVKLITNEIRPSSVLVIGCGDGRLVEMLRQQRVEAYGSDRDPALLDRAHPKIRPYLTRAAAADLPDGPFALIVALDALGDLTHDTATEVVQAIRRRTTDVLFLETTPGSPLTPPDWAGMFAGQGFFRDLDFEAPPGAPQLARFRRKENVDPANIAQAYESWLWHERETGIEQRARIRALEKRIETERQENESVVKALAARVEQRDSQIADIESSTTWRLLHFLRLSRSRLAPAGTRRSAFLDMLRNSLVGLREGGFESFFRVIRRDLASDGLWAAQGEKSTAETNAELYADFVRRTTPDPETLAQQRAESAGWDDRPLISFITPVYAPPADVLQATIDSVRAQTYDHWELCIADASPDSPEVRALLEKCAEQDDRIRVKFLDLNLGISGNSNAAIETARGEYIAILDHDDVLAPDMLYRVVRRIREKHLADLIYFDEDKLSEDGQTRRNPFFKPDFSPEMLISVNYLTHAVYRRSLVAEVGGFDSAFDGCQDWDLAFKVTERTNEVEHIPAVLYHWRQVSGSTAGEFRAKSYVFERQLACVQAHLQRRGLAGATASFKRPGFLHAAWPPSGRKVSIIIPTKDNLSFLKRTIKSIQSKTSYTDYEILIVDNGSRQRKTLQYFEQLRSREAARIVAFNEMFNYSRANNLGALVAKGEILLFLNNDVEVLHADWLEEMVRWVDRDEIGIVGAKLLYPDETVQHAGVVVGLEGHASHIFWGYRDYESGPFGSADWYRNFSAITGACMMMRRDTFEKIGRFEEGYILAFSDIEICLRAIEHGYRVMYTPHARLRHYEGKSRGSHIPSNDILVGIEDFQALVERGDPYFNPNLSYNARKPTIRTGSEEDRLARLQRVAAMAQIKNLKRSA